METGCTYWSLLFQKIEIHFLSVAIVVNPNEHTTYVQIAVCAPNCYFLEKLNFHKSRRIYLISLNRFLKGYIKLRVCRMNNTMKRTKFLAVKLWHTPKQKCQNFLYLGVAEETWGFLKCLSERVPFCRYCHMSDCVFFKTQTICSICFGNTL